MSTALGIQGFETPCFCDFRLVGRFEVAKLDFDRHADVTFDSVACSSAFRDAKVFHRDPSLGNIMIGCDGKGRLNDWDLCRGVEVDKSLQGPRTVRVFLI